MDVSCMIHIHSIKINNMAGNSSLNIGSAFHSNPAATAHKQVDPAPSDQSHIVGSDKKRREELVWRIGEGLGITEKQ